MIVNRRLFLYKGIDIGNCDKDLYGSFRHCLGYGKLVQITGLIVVNGTPMKVFEVTGRSGYLRYCFPDSIELGKGLRRKIGKKPSVKHRPTGNSLQNGAVLCVVGICHAIIFLKKYYFTRTTKS
jgi:hypothetical protein